jgi:glycerol-3-phosphate dehydrogenase
VAVPDVVEAAKEADILVFVVPHQFIRTLCSTLLGKIKPTAVGLSLIKVCGLEVLVMQTVMYILQFEQRQANGGGYFLGCDTM